ncbi:hypothetical protein [Larkinella terrae]|nr:hypothetical protein [Larkinella terrae]
MTNKVGVLTLTLSVLCFFSCEKLQMAPGQTIEPTSNASSLQNTSSAFLGKTSYQLTSFDKSNLTYYPDGRIWRVQEKDVPSGYYLEFQYAPNWITATQHSPEGKMVQETFLLNAKGQCYHSDYYGFLLDKNGVWLHSCEYQYNNANQLVRINLKSDPGGSVFPSRREFTYDAYGDLIRIESFNTTNFKIGEEVFAYTSASQPRKVDQYPLNHHYSLACYADFLPIFGKLNKHLLRSTVHTSFSPQGKAPIVSNKTVKYNSFNRDGFVLDMDVSYGGNGHKILSTYAILP